jgi:mycoredoxin
MVAPRADTPRGPDVLPILTAGDSVERRTWLLVAGVGLALATWEGLRGQIWAAALTAVTLGALAWWMSPWRAPGGATHREVRARPEGERGLVVYRRPGCPYCERLRRRIGRDRDAVVTWVDIWRDAEAAAFVRGVNDGNETVPTVVADGTAYSNPEPSEVLELLPRS